MEEGRSEQESEAMETHSHDGGRWKPDTGEIVFPKLKRVRKDPFPSSVTFLTF